jgi:hypothetical protein
VLEKYLFIWLSYIFLKIKTQMKVVFSNKRRINNRILYYCLLLQLEEEELMYYEYIHARDRRIPRIALIDPNCSPWQHLYVAGNDQAFITFLGLDKKTFDYLVSLFEPFYDRLTPHSSSGMIMKIKPGKILGGRPRKIDAKSCVALVLSYYRFKGPFFILQGWFGITHSAISVWSLFTMKILISIIKNDKEYEIIMPNDEKIRYYQELIKKRHPLLDGVFCVCDGLKLNLEKPRDIIIQSRFYNGWTHGHYISNLFVFGADGKIIFCVINAPGSIHDSTLAGWGGLYDILQDIYDRLGGKCCMDSAFAALNNPCIIRSSENDYHSTNARELLIHKEATSLRQSAEWGMRAIQSAFPRVTNRIRYEEKGTRAIMMRCMVLLYNFRLKNVGLNQIQTVYEPFLQQSSESVFL